MENCSVVFYGWFLFVSRKTDWNNTRWFVASKSARLLVSKYQHRTLQRRVVSQWHRESSGNLEPPGEARWTGGLLIILTVNAGSLERKYCSSLLNTSFSRHVVLHGLIHDSKNRVLLSVRLNQPKWPPPHSQAVQCSRWLASLRNDVKTKQTSLVRNYLSKSTECTTKHSPSANFRKKTTTFGEISGHLANAVATQLHNTFNAAELNIFVPCLWWRKPGLRYKCVIKVRGTTTNAKPTVNATGINLRARAGKHHKPKTYIILFIFLCTNWKKNGAKNCVRK